jgi:tetratricopeptide (TPR) repeat protein
MGTRVGSIWLRGCAVFLLAALAASGASARNSAVIPVDILRHPITARVRKLLLSAMAKIDVGEDTPAIEQLQETLRKYPDSAPYVQNLLGVEYVRTDQLPAAISSFEQAVSLLPNEAMTHYNFGLALVCAGDYDRAAREVRRAVELDPRNEQMRARLSKILAHGRSGN